MRPGVDCPLDALLPGQGREAVAHLREAFEVSERRAKPLTIVSDNGTELTGMAILKWSQDRKVDWHYITPRKPMQNGFVESFMRRRPRGRKCFESDVHRRVRSCIRPVCAVLT